MNLRIHPSSYPHVKSYFIFMNLSAPFLQNESKRDRLLIRQLECLSRDRLQFAKAPERQNIIT